MGRERRGPFEKVAIVAATAMSGKPTVSMGVDEAGDHYAAAEIFSCDRLRLGREVSQLTSPDDLAAAD
jgi:hypothetical protein